MPARGITGIQGETLVGPFGQHLHQLPAREPLGQAEFKCQEGGVRPRVLDAPIADSPLLVAVPSSTTKPTGGVSVVVLDSIAGSSAITKIQAGPACRGHRSTHQYAILILIDIFKIDQDVVIRPIYPPSVEAGFCYHPTINTRQHHILPLLRSCLRRPHDFPACVV